MVRRKAAGSEPVPEPAGFKSADSQSDVRLFRLAERMRLADHALQAAMDELAAAEQRLSKWRRTKGSGRPPAWYGAAVRRERTVGAALEEIYKAIARARARTRSGLAIKVRVLATLYGEVLDQGPDQSDMVSVMIHSLLADCSA
jgi:predicted ArsR family transcriptional regulator